MSDQTKPLPDFSDVSGGSSSEAMTHAEAVETHHTYTVVAGDSLSKISKHFYGDAAKWKTIWDANKSQIKNPDLIQIGQVLSIPKM
ncbi:MAG: LysM peptidoglycan-binding domain-containing protein [Phycisphaerae bacterium]|nr:LysM peptidoglycan-binding domain-containing protein [Gemmatimonadaceae bacterium]